MNLLLCCESAACNHGVSAEAREDAIIRGLPKGTVDLRDEADKYARSLTSRQLAVTPHTHVGTDGRGNHRYTCDVCGQSRIYGNQDYAMGVLHEGARGYFGRATFGGDPV